MRSHWASSSSTLRRETEPLLRALLGIVVGFDQPVALEPLQRGVHLADVEGPDLAGPGFELLPQLETVFGAFAQKAQQGVPDAHDSFAFVSILGILLHRSTSVQCPEPQHRRRIDDYLS